MTAESLAGVTLRRVDTLEDANTFMRWLGERRPVLAVDTETTGLDTRKDKVRLVQFGDAYTGWTVPWERWAGLVSETFSRYTERYAFHNGPYDLAMLKNSCGIDVPTHRVDDTMFMAHVLDSTRSIALKPLASVHIDPNAAAADRMLQHAMAEHKWDWATIPIDVPVYSVYAAMDTVLTARMHNILLPQVMQASARAYDLELAFAWVVMRMEARGVRIDRSYTEQALSSFEQYAAQVAEWCRQTYGVNPTQNQHVVKRLEDDGIIFSKLTASGDKFALDKDVLTELVATGHPLASAVQQHRKVAYLISHYLRGFPRFADTCDDLMHADMFSLGTRTGRMSIKDPPLQTLPRRSEANPLAITVRNCIVAREGNALAMVDWDQLEMRVLASYAQDPGLQAAFSEGDFFANMAHQIFNDTTIVKGDERRQRVKNAAYAKVYGAGTAQFARTAGISSAEGAAFMQRFDEIYPGVCRFQGEVAHRAASRRRSGGRAYVQSFTGRYHYALDNKDYALVNYLIQGMSAEILKLKTLEVDAAGLGEYLTLLVHDEVMLDVPVEHAADAAGTLQRIMHDSTLLSVPLTAASEFGYRWGEKGTVTLEELAQMNKR